VLVPDPNFRPNPDRAIYVQGTIDQVTVDRLTPEIMRLTAGDRGPISVYIDSPGGNVASAELILKLLQATNQENDPPCWLITVVTSRAASAAADLLSSGNYAIAYPDSTLLYHGVRTPSLSGITVEFAAMLAESMKISNDRYAMALTRKSEWRFMFRFMGLRGKFAGHRASTGKPKLSELDCFVEMIRENISTKAKPVIDQAYKRYQRYNDLITHFLKVATRDKRFMGGGGRAYSEGVMLRGIINFEIASNKKNKEWTFQDGGLVRLTDDFYLLQEYFSSVASDQFRQICGRWGQFVLSDEQKAELDTIPEAEKEGKTLEKVTPYFQPLWSFFVALCHALQEGENELTGVDAFWLGLIDEVIGMPSLPVTRYIAEYQADPEPVALKIPPPDAGQL
jgi:ATP-dependent protease ClpP protease subunit